MKTFIEKAQRYTGTEFIAYLQKQVKHKELFKRLMIALHEHVVFKEQTVYEEFVKLAYEQGITKEELKPTTLGRIQMCLQTAIKLGFCKQYIEEVIEEYGPRFVMQCLVEAVYFRKEHLTYFYTKYPEVIEQVAKKLGKQKLMEYIEQLKK